MLLKLGKGVILTKAEKTAVKKDVKRLKADLTDLDRIYDDMLQRGMKLDVDGAIAFYERRKAIRDKLEVAEMRLSSMR